MELLAMLVGLFFSPTNVALILKVSFLKLISKMKILLNKPAELQWTALI